jgi:hypothetical protein
MNALRTGLYEIPASILRIKSNIVTLINDLKTHNINSTIGEDKFIENLSKLLSEDPETILYLINFIIEFYNNEKENTYREKYIIQFLEIPKLIDTTIDEGSLKILSSVCILLHDLKNKKDTIIRIIKNMEGFFLFPDYYFRFENRIINTVYGFLIKLINYKKGKTIDNILLLYDKIYCLESTWKTVEEREIHTEEDEEDKNRKNDEDMEAAFFREEEEREKKVQQNKTKRKKNSPQNKSRRNWSRGI